MEKKQYGDKRKAIPAGTAEDRVFLQLLSVPVLKVQMWCGKK